MTGALAAWAESAMRVRPEVRAIGYFGSYARGDWGVGSDLDVIILVAYEDQPFARRAGRWDLTHLPVPVDVLVYSLDEWESLRGRGRFGLKLQDETIWLYPPPHRSTPPPS
ncbi:MAG: nucleotidyltransferase domain-containing protein [Chloroflexota bacterium]